MGHRGRLTHPQRLRRFGVPRGLVWQGVQQKSPWQRAPRGTGGHLTNPGRRGRGLGGVCSGKCSTAGSRAVTIAIRVSRETQAPDWVAALTRPALRRSPLVTKAGPDWGMWARSGRLGWSLGSRGGVWAELIVERDSPTGRIFLTVTIVGRGDGSNW